ncbi:hypothetical protein N0A02_32945 (plasmid) [Paraburkholderia acidicola]|uniref:Uncharacterized protein n=1 Tax=Paraburkholderia acidicola TaxID=1912599 RepID=A0ABV1M002_9BURK
MININYPRLGFGAGLLVGLAAFLCGAAFFGAFWFLESVAPSSGLHDFIDDHVSLPLLIAIPVVLFAGIPVVALLLHRRIACTFGMLLVIVPTTFYGSCLMIGVALSNVKCLGSCG